MANLKEVKERINSVVSTQQITKAMKMVAAAKLRRAQDKITQMRPYSQKLTGILNNVTASSEGETDVIFAQKREVTRVLLVPVTSDKGLCGAFNTNVLKATKSLLVDYAAQEVSIMPLGKKAYDAFRRGPHTLIDTFYTVFADVSFENVNRAASFAMESFVNENFDKVIIVYNQFKNVATQEVIAEQFLPMEQIASEDTKAVETDYILEPSREYIIEELVPAALKIQFFKTVLESNASEHGARMTAMDKATENAGELLKDLRLMYNRSRQAAITNEILEIVAGANALESK
ncbi:MAG: ATP synthase F1 subunit gamma [Nitritalea sp.]